MSGRNLPSTHVLPFSDVSTYHILWSDIVVVENSALGGSREAAEQAETAENDSEAVATPRRAAKKTTRKAATKTAGRKTAAKKTVAKKSTAKKAAAKKTTTAKKKGK
jgi:ribonuclease E